MTDPREIERRLGVFARPVLTATEHGWPPDPQVLQERMIRFGGQASRLADAVVSVRAQRYEELTGEPYPDTQPQFGGELPERIPSIEIYPPF